MAIKATYSIVDGKEIMIFKDPKTDDGTKKSLKGLCYVEENDGEFSVIDKLNYEDYTEINKSGKNKLIKIYEDGKIYNFTTLSKIRERLRTSS